MYDFHSPIANGFARVAAANIPIKVGDPAANAISIIEAANLASEAGASVVVFQELTLVGVTADDLLFQDTMHEECETAIETIKQASVDWPLVALFGTPLRVSGKTLNAAVAVTRGQIVGIWFDPVQNDPMRKRWFSSCSDASPAYSVILDQPLFFASEIPLTIQDVPGLSISVQLQEPIDYQMQAKHGVSLVANLGGAPAFAGTARHRLARAREASRTAKLAVVYVGAGEGESTTDYAWDGQAFIVEAGEVLAQNDRFGSGVRLTYADIDLARLQAERKLSSPAQEEMFASQQVRVQPRGDWTLERRFPRFPYLDTDPELWKSDLEDMFDLQVQALMRRLEATGNPHPVIGISGGLDSTLALLVCVEAMERMGRPRTDILTFTMPGFATTSHTKNNATKLCEVLGTTFEVIDIRDTARQMLADMGHPFGRGEEVYDVTFENVQAGLRTDFLFRIANGRRGLVIGTGDYSELMLGWCTFGVGDHMSHYSVNPGVPKTLMQHLIRWIMASNRFGEDVNDTLDSILNTEITPELIPTREGEEAQSTQAMIGPYSLQDFNAYYLVYLGLSPELTAFRALNAWSNADEGVWPDGLEAADRAEFDLQQILTWERVFLRRFFTNQFKRSTLANGPRVLEGANLSPRGGLMLASDLSPAPWLARIDKLADSLGIELEKR